MTLPDADEAQKLASSKNDALADLMEKATEAINKSIDESRYKAQIDVSREVKSTVTALRAKLFEKGYRTETKSIMSTGPECIDKVILIIEYGPTDDTQTFKGAKEKEEVPQAGEITYQAVELPEPPEVPSKEIIC